MQKDTSPLGNQSFLSLAPSSHPRAHTTLILWASPHSGPHLVYGEHVLLPQRTSGGRAVPPHSTLAVLCCQDSQPFLHPGPRETDIHPVPLSSPSHYHKAPHLRGSTQLGGRGIRGNTNNLVQKLFQFTTNHFKNSSNFHFLNLYTSRWGVRSHKIYFLLLSLARLARYSYNSL